MPSDLILGVGVYAVECCVTFLTGQGSLQPRLVGPLHSDGFEHRTQDKAWATRELRGGLSRIPSSVPEGTSRDALELPAADGSSVGRSGVAFRVLSECEAADPQGDFWESESRHTKSCTFF